MQYKKWLTIGVLTALCLSFGAQSVAAQENEFRIQTAIDDGIGEITPEGEQTEDMPPKEQALKVTGLHTTGISDTRVLLEWDDCECADYYCVYRKTENGNFTKLDVTEQTSFKDTGIVFGKSYEYKIVPYNEDQEGEEASIRFVNQTAVNIKKQKYSYSQMKTDMKELSNKYSDYCKLTSIGKSVEGRNIYDLAIGNPKAEESLLVVSTLHAREYICSVILMQQIEYYLRNYHKSLDGIKPADVLENRQIHYIVMANPDGVMISQTENSRWKANSRGVNLNQNFPAKKFVVYGKPGPTDYTGKRALSEPETKAIADLTKMLQNEQALLGVVNYHAMGQIIFGSCKVRELKKATQTMYKIAKEETGYSDASGYSWGGPEINSSYRDYLTNMLKIPSITLEVGSTIAPCSYKEYASAFKKNKMVLLKIADAL